MSGKVLKKTFFAVGVLVLAGPLSAQAAKTKKSAGKATTQFITGVQFIDGFERPEWATVAMWKTTVSRRILKGQVTGFIGRVNSSEKGPKKGLCTLVDVPAIQQIAPIEIKYPSAQEYKTGTYYDAIRPLTAKNCGASPYFYFEGKAGIHLIGDGKITINEVKRAAPKAPSVPFFAFSGNSFMIKGWCGATYCGGEQKAMELSSLLVKHRMQPYGSEVLPYDGLTDNPNGFAKAVLPYSISATNMLVAGVTDEQLEQQERDVLSHPEWKLPWFYAQDEPSDIPAMKKVLARLKTHAPSIKRMVTTTFNKDYDIDIYCPIADQLGTPGHPPAAAYAGKTLWSYVSCISNGCGPDRAGAKDPKVISHTGYPASGAPDLVIDASAVNEFGMYLLAFRYNLKGVLYYNVAEGWKLWEKGIDIWTDPYNFGGNGDGTMVYPDRENKGIFPSIRIKLIREASQWADTVQAAGLGEMAAAQLMTNSIKWEHDLKKFEALREKALDKL
jgi:hypothetical protein